MFRKKPRIAARHQPLILQRLEEIAAFNERYKLEREKYIRLGKQHASFPYGTWKMRVQFLTNCEPRPPTQRLTPDIPTKGGIHRRWQAGLFKAASLQLFGLDFEADLSLIEDIGSRYHEHELESKKMNVDSSVFLTARRENPFGAVWDWEISSRGLRYHR